ncbi:RNA-dependent RNA polymerase [Hymenoscyphus fraxineus mitovirus 1]|uniref:RNA-dependent RNA polymerase n=1 Tax=Hymenoscyphus fraxineus mitovirus 1 TaxID=1564031 RepID=A0ABM5RVC9_9VIRU|nr:RNA-dependent RNA polymerase [Hymenoscyphus fraxineus mitovirus 1]AIU44705.1 RNA-dependent RNA polymerase [Hymenoscyphus fraxineus mitovirus 1]
MTKQINKIKVRLTLITGIAHLKLSLILFCHWSNNDPHITSLVKHAITRFENLATTRGLNYAILEFKASRLAFTRWLCGRPLRGKANTPITKAGLPKVIPREVRFLLHDGKPDYLVKAVITVLSIGRYFLGGNPIDLDAITRSATPINPKDNEIILALGKLGVDRQQRAPDQWSYDWITTAGPNGPSISSCLWDLPQFLSKFKAPATVLLPDLVVKLEKLAIWEKSHNLSSLLKLNNWRNGSLRKLAIKDDKEGKSRVFAIFDYWSQTTLTPLHDWAFSTLRKIPQDCTFNQQEGVEKILRLKTRKHYYSYDLKSATDRFPARFQRKVLSLIFTTDYANAWLEIMTKEPFTLKGSETAIKWRVGQPLGAKSSWGIFTLCHHVVVNIAAIRSNSDAHYIILGDDIVLRGRALATEYKRIMSNLGVEISESKSHVSKDTFEFAKLWTHKGVNVSGFPIVGLAESLRKPLELALLFIYEVPQKGYFYDLTPRSLSHFFSHLASCSVDPPRFAIFMANRACWFYAFISWLVTKEDGWAKYLVQSVSVIAPPSLAAEAVFQTTSKKWAKEVMKGIHDLSIFAINILYKVREEIPMTRSSWDREAWPGRFNASGIEFIGYASQIPILAALSKESNVAHSDYLQSVTEGSQTIQLEELEKLKLPPSPQLKGFEPVRTRGHIRALNKLCREYNRGLSVEINDIRTDRCSDVPDPTGPTSGKSGRAR